MTINFVADELFDLAVTNISMMAHSAKHGNSANVAEKSEIGAIAKHD